jgi:hypothetical protein
MDPYFSDMRQKLIQAISSGELARDSSLEDSSAKLSQILELDELDLVEIDMELEALGIERRTVSSLVEYFERGGPDAADSPMVKR